MLSILLCFVYIIVISNVGGLLVLVVLIGPVLHVLLSADITFRLRWENIRMYSIFQHFYYCFNLSIINEGEEAYCTAWSWLTEKLFTLGNKYKYNPPSVLIILNNGLEYQTQWAILFHFEPSINNKRRAWCLVTTTHAHAQSFIINIYFLSLCLNYIS